MFSEYDIVDYCRQCRGGCSNLQRCPLRMEQAPVRKQGIVPFMAGRFPLTGYRFSAPVNSAGSYSIDELIAGLSRLNSNF